VIVTIDDVRAEGPRCCYGAGVDLATVAQDIDAGDHARAWSLLDEVISDLDVLLRALDRAQATRPGSPA